MRGVDVALEHQLGLAERPRAGQNQPADRQQATLLLKQQGLSDKQIQDGLAVPVFFTKPFLSLTPSQLGDKSGMAVEPKLVFFMSYASLQAAIAKLPSAKQASLKPQVAELSAVLRQIIQSPQDRYVIFPTADYFQLIQQRRQNPQRQTLQAQPQSPSQPLPQSKGQASSQPVSQSALPAR